MSDTYGVTSGQGDAPGLPQVNLPSFNDKAEPKPLKIVVGGKPPSAPPAAAGKDPWADYPEEPPKAAKAAPGAAEAEPWAAYPDEAPPPAREIGTGEAALKGATKGVTFGLAPAIEGLSEAAGPRSPAFEAAGYEDPTRPIVGGVKMLLNAFSNHPDPTIKESYERGRQRALSEQEAAEAQHKLAFFLGQMGGSMVMPAGSGVMAPATLGVRLARGAGVGALGGGAVGAGEAISEGKSAPEVAKAGIESAAGGAPLGALTLGVLGPRARVPGGTAGERAARTAEGLGAPITKGLASDNPAINATTAALRKFPVAGSRVSSAVGKTQEAAGQAINETAAALGGQTERAVADTVARPALQTVIDANLDAQNAGYNALRGQIDHDATQFTMPRTEAAVTAAMRERKAAHWQNPAQDLEQFRDAAGGSTFDGAHRARVDARNAGDVVSPNPGYRAGDFNRIARAMTEDLREMAQAAAKDQTPQGRKAALNAFDEAENNFGKLADQNKGLKRLVASTGEASIAKILSAAKESGGNLKLLVQLKQGMDPADFQSISGTLLHELGKTNAAEQPFSFSKFATEWSKLSNGAKGVMFSPAHRYALEELAHLGSHIRGALKESNTSHTAGPLILFDMARDAVMLAGGIGMGVISGSTVATGGVPAAAGVLFAHWLASPAKAASLSNWSRAFRAVTGTPTAQRIAVFNIATRNLSHTIGVPMEKLSSAIVGRVGQAEQPQAAENH
jgi:hypothetical protein